MGDGSATPVRGGFVAGGLLAFPICVNYLLIGTTAGVISSQMGMSVLEIALLSLFLYAGSAQFLFATIYTGPLAVLVVSIFNVNARHFVYSMALSLQARRLGKWARAAIGAQLTDESFLVSSTALRRRQIQRASWMIGINCASHLAWICGNVTGAVSTAAIDFEALGAGHAPAAMFLVLILLQVGKSREGMQALLVAIVSASCTFVAHRMGHGGLALVVLAPAVALMAALLVRPGADDVSLAAQPAHKEGSQ